MGIPSIDRATQNLVQWAARGEWETLQREFFEAHFEPVTNGLDLPDDAFEVLPDEDGGMLSVFVLEEFFTARFGAHGELNVVDDYLKRRGWRESVPARRYLEALRDSTLSLYEVIDIIRGRHMMYATSLHTADSARTRSRSSPRSARCRSPTPPFGDKRWCTTGGGCSRRTRERAPASTTILEQIGETLRMLAKNA